MMKVLPSLLLLLLLLLTHQPSRAVAIQQQQQQGFNVYLLLQSMASQESVYRSAFTDPQVCYDRMISADNDSSYQLDRQEYVKFTKLSGPPQFLLEITEFEDLPLALQSTFNALSCLCPGSSRTNCCNDLLGINGAGGDADDSEENDLFLICSLSRLAIDYVAGASQIPTSAPTREPSSPPTMSPSMSPSASPTTTPSAKPSVSPTSMPTTQPSVAPSTAPSIPPPPTISPAPSMTASEPPTGVPVIPVEYRVGVTNGVYEPETYESLLTQAMDSLAPEVLVTTLGERRVLRRRRRRLQSVVLPTQIVEYLQDECDAFLPSEDGCAVIQGSVVLQNADDAMALEFGTKLQEAIASGELSDKLQTQNPDTPLYIIDDPLLDSLSGAREILIEEEDDSGTVTGVAIAGVLVFSACLLFYIWRDRQQDKDELEPLPPATRDLGFLDQDGVDVQSDKEPTLVEKMLPVSTPERKKKKRPSKSMSPNRADHDSDAGDSGWSSSAGVSSLNTGDNNALGEEDFQDPAQVGSQMGSSLGTPGSSGQDDVSVPTTSSVTRADLDNAIEAGDWAAVGATAALLAAASDSNSYSSRSLTNPGTSTRDGTSTVSSFEAAHVAELDHLVDAGDWEGVVLAAARFEASTVASDSESRMSSSLASSKTRKQQEFRAQVEELVQRVAPEESGNIDEMILQFRGREDELIETLKIMEERKKSQDAAQTTTSSNSNTPTRARSLGTGTLTPQRKKTGSVSSSLGPPQVEGSSKSLGTGVLQMTPREQKQSRLEQAIEAGDWEAVGEAAAMLNDTQSASSADTDEINRLADGLSAGTGDFSTESGKKRSDKAEELDKLIDQGDWMGVVQAAADLESDDYKKKARKSWFSIDKKGKDEKQDDRIKKLKAEQEALEQADMWMAIAEKSKDDNKKDDRGASEAADWAIGRSLAALVEAEGSTNKKNASGGDTEEYEV